MSGGLLIIDNTQCVIYLIQGFTSQTRNNGIISDISSSAAWPCAVS